MDPIYLLLVSISLGADATAASLSCGLVEGDGRNRKGLFIAGVFGSFQGGMALVGWLFGSIFVEMVDQYANWIAFALLTSIGIHMVVEGIRNRKADKECGLIKVGTTFILGFATSIDALIVGTAFGILGQGILLPVFFIGSVTFIMSMSAFLIGSRIKTSTGWVMDVLGGSILIILGLNFLTKVFFQ